MWRSLVAHLHGVQGVTKVRILSHRPIRNGPGYARHKELTTLSSSDQIGAAESADEFCADFLGMPWARLSSRPAAEPTSRRATDPDSACAESLKPARRTFTEGRWSTSRADRQGAPPNVGLSDRAGCDRVRKLTRLTLTAQSRPLARCSCPSARHPPQGSQPRMDPIRNERIAASSVNPIAV